VARLQVALLGKPLIYHNDRPVTFPTRKALGLFTYLIVEGGEHNRAEMTALLWPNSNSAHGRGALRVTLAQLRDALHESEEQLPHLISDRETLAFNTSSEFTLDLNNLPFNRARERNHVDAQDEKTTLRTAVENYRGEFMAGFSLDDAPEFDQWVTIQREFWSSRIEPAINRLCEIYLNSDEVTPALDLAHRWMLHNPLNEMAYQRLIQAHLAAHEPSTAIRVFEACQQTLQRELGISPSPDIIALIEGIRTHSQGQAVVRQAVPKQGSDLSLLDELPYVGRAQEFARLVRLAETVRVGQGRVGTAVIEGEAGSGKTRLSNEFLTWALAHEFDTTEGRAFEAGGRLPYQPIMDALRRRVADENAPEDLLDDVWLSELSRLLPELRERYPDLSAPTADDLTARNRLFEAVASAFLAFTRHKPMIVFIDDLQWADTASLDMMHYVVDRLARDQAPIFFLFCLRTEARTALADWLHSLERVISCTHIALTSLSFGDIQQLVGRLSDDTVGDRGANFSQWLFDETNGQPFYTVEMFKMLLERHLIRAHLATDRAVRFDFPTIADLADLNNTIPTGVREIIRWRIHALTPEALSLLFAGAVLGQHLRFDTLRQVAGLDEDSALAALDLLTTNRLLHETIQSDYEFSHDKIRDVVYAEASAARKRVFHRRALEALGTEDPSRQAHHAFGAGLFDKAFHLNIEAGDDAIAVFAVRDAIRFYQHAHRLLSNWSSPDIHLLEHLYTQLGRAHELQDDFVRAEDAYQTLLSAAQAAGAARIACVTLNRLATLAAHTEYKMELAFQRLEEARQTAVASGDLLALTETEWNHAQLSFYANDAKQSLVHGARALELARSLAVPELTARSLVTLSMTNLVTGHCLEGEVKAQEALTIYTRENNRAMMADVLCIIANIQRQLGNVQIGLDYAQQALKISLEIGNAWGQVHSGINLASGLLDMGRYADALSAANRVIELAREIHSILHGWGLSVLGAVYRAMHNYAQAAIVHQQGLDQARQKEHHVLELQLSQLSADYALMGDWQTAYQHAREALSVRSGAFFSDAGLVRWLEIEALLRQGEFALARESVYQFGSEIGDMLRYRVPYLRAQAIVCLWENDLDHCEKLLHEALTLAESLSLPGEQESLWVALADLHQRQNDPLRVEAAYARAHQLQQSLGVRIES
jgi:DNA-binding SARP family transcriptional activator/tetratricopeptide (TPR) repeat protein